MRILIVGANPFMSSAYGNICRYIATTLSLKHQVLVFGEGWQGTLCRVGKFTLLPCQINSEGKDKTSGAYRVIQAIHRYKPHAVLTIGDMLVLDYFSRFKRRPFWIAHFPVDSEPYRNIELPIIRRADIRVIPSKYGVKVLRDFHKMKSYYIPHPVAQEFKPIDKMKARKIFGFKKKHTIFGYVGTNSRRKEIPRLMEAFANEFKKNKDVKLWLHTVRWDDRGWNLPYLAEFFGIKKQVFFTPYLDYFNVTPTELNVVYNSLDVHCLTSSAEGFGMPIAESMKVGVPNIVTDYSASPEIMGKGGIKVPYTLKFLDGFASYKALVDIPKLQVAMRSLYDNPSLRKELSLEALERAKEFEYSKVMADWLTFIDLIGESKEYKAWKKWKFRRIPDKERKRDHSIPSRARKGT